MSNTDHWSLILCLAVAPQCWRLNFQYQISLLRDLFRKVNCPDVMLMNPMINVGVSTRKGPSALWQFEPGAVDLQGYRPTTQHWTLIRPNSSYSGQSWPRPGLIFRFSAARGSCPQTFYEAFIDNEGEEVRCVTGPAETGDPDRYYQYTSLISLEYSSRTLLSVHLRTGPQLPDPVR